MGHGQSDLIKRLYEVDNYGDGAFIDFEEGNVSMILFYNDFYKWADNLDKSLFNGKGPLWWYIKN